MDPDANLAEQREIRARMEHAQDHDDNLEGDYLDDACRLVELVGALDEWIASGGFLPAAWRNR